MVNRQAKPLWRGATPLITGHSQGRRPAAPSASSTPAPLGVALKAQHQVRHKIAGAELLAHVLPAKEALERLFHLLEDAKLFHGGLAGWKLRALSLLAAGDRLFYFYAADIVVLKSGKPMLKPMLSRVF